jgi:hypothetical protein
MSVIPHCPGRAAASCCIMLRVILAVFHDRAHADPLALRLVSEGIGAEVHDGLTIEKLWWVSKDTTGARLSVPNHQSDLAHARLLSMDAADGALRDAIHCPNCKSVLVEYPQFTRNSLLPNLVVGLLATIARVPKEFYCADCHQMWPPVATSSPSGAFVAPSVSSDPARASSSRPNT